MIRKALTRLQSVSPYSQSRHFTPEAKSAQEGKDAIERRCWRQRMNTTAAGEVFIPPMAFKLAIGAAARYRSRPVPGKGKATFTKHFTSGVMVVEPLLLGIQAATVLGEELFVPADGKPGSGSRVIRIFPLIVQWSGRVEWLVVDDTITEGEFEATLKDAGAYIGIGRFRPENRGFYGRFQVLGVEWE